MRTSPLLVALLVGSLFSSPSAFSWWWSSSNGIQITADSDSSLYEPGTQAQINGTIRQRKISGALRSIPYGQFKKLETRYYFPDLTNEVTDQVVSSGRLDFSYQTPSLQSSDVNTFYVTVGKTDPRVRRLQRIKGKLDRRISGLNELIVKLEQQGVPQQKIDHIARVRDFFQGISDRITAKLAFSTETIAEIHTPLQVNNAIAFPSYNKSLMSGFLFELSFNPGVLIQGNETRANAKITNVSGLTQGWDFGHGSRAKWLIEFLFQGEVVRSIGPKKMASGESESHEIISDSLSPGNTNLAIRLKRNFFGSNRTFGFLEQELNVFEDTEKPVWTVRSPSNPYVQTPENLNASISESLGLIDKDSLSATLTGVLSDGSELSKDLLDDDVISLVKVESGQAYNLSGPLSPLEEGAYTLTLTGADQAGNFASEFRSDFNVDRTPPVLSQIFPGPTDFVTSVAFNLMGKSNEPLQSISVNSRNLTLSDDRRAFSGSYTSTVPGQIELSFVAMDMAGNTIAVKRQIRLPSTTVVDVVPQTLSADQAGFRLKVQSFGTSTIGLNKVFATINSVKLIESGGSVHAASSGSVVSDLGIVAESRFAQVASSIVPPQEYREIQIEFAPEGMVELANGDSAPLVLNSSSPIAVQLDPRVAFRGERISELQLRLLVDQSITQSGNSYMFSPVFEVENMIDLTPRQSRIVGTVLQGEADLFVSEADSILQGVVIKTAYKTQNLMPNLPMLFTDVTIRVDDSLKGAHGDEITLEVLGGKWGDLEIFPTHVPRFSVREGSILFLKQYENGLGLVRGERGKIGGI